MDDHVGFRGLRVDAVIGVREHERRRRQPIEIDVEIRLDAELAAQSDDLAKTVSYSDIARLVSEVAVSKPHGLLERLAADCCRAVMREFPAISSVTVEIRKPLALGGPAVPYVRLHRERDLTA
jgi:dihydroneopterin aldolase